MCFEVLFRNTLQEHKRGNSNQAFFLPTCPHLVDHFAIANSSILILLASHGGTFCNGIRFGCFSTSVDICHRSVVLSYLTHCFHHCSLDRLCTQERSIGGHPYDLNFLACTSINHRNGCRKSLVHVPVASESALLENWRRSRSCEAFASFYSAFRM